MSLSTNGILFQDSHVSNLERREQENWTDGNWNMRDILLMGILESAFIVLGMFVDMEPKEAH